MALLFITGLLTGCGPQEEIVEITFIHGFGTAEDTHVAMRQIYSDFEKTHQGIKLNMISLPSSVDVVEKVGNMLAIGEVPDIIFTAGEGKESIYEYMIAQDKVLDLMPYLEKDEEFYENLSPVILEDWQTEQGALYTVSDVLFMIGYWYNCSLFEQAGITELPKTWEDFEQVCKQLKLYGQNTGEGTLPLILDIDHMIYITNAILHEGDGSDNEKLRKNLIDLQTPGFQKSLDQLKTFSQYTDVIDVYSFRDSLDAFNKEQTAIYMNGVWGSYLIDQELDVAYAPFPSEEGESVSMISSCIGYLLGNTKDQKKMDASIEFLKYMLSEPVAQRILEETGQMPSNPKVKISEEIAEGRVYHAVEKIKEVDRVIEVPANIWSRELQKVYGENMILYIEERISIQEMEKNLEEFLLNYKVNKVQVMSKKNECYLWLKADKMERTRSVSFENF